MHSYLTSGRRAVVEPRRAVATGERWARYRLTWPQCRGVGAALGKRGFRLDYQHILWEQQEGVAIITLNRPQALTALNPQAARVP